MVADSSGTKQKIVLAAIACIEREGIERVTVRGIAREAGVNLALINYYFGGKDRLLEAALELTLDTGFDLSELDEALERLGDLRAAVEWFVLDYLTNMQKYPRVAEAHLRDARTGGELPPEFARRVAGFVRGLAERLEPVLGGSEEERVRTVAQLWSGVMFPGLLPGFFRGAGVDVADAEQRIDYVRALIARFLGGG